MHKLVLFFSLLIFHNVVGQMKYPSKLNVVKVINLTITQKPNSKNNHSCELGQCGEWWISDDNSGFYKGDTLKLYNSGNIAYNDKNVCHFKIWDFVNENLFSETEAEMCTEPPTITIMNISPSIQKSQPNKYQIIDNGNICFINIYVDNTILKSYKVIDLLKTTENNLGNNSYVLKIARQK